MPQQKQPLQMSHQAVGAYGEKVVEGELLRRGWITSNVNASIKNAVDFDLFALKQDGLAASEVDVSRRQVLQALMVSVMIVVLDEAVDVGFEVTR